MNGDNRKELKDLIKKVEQFRDDIYDYDYDETALWHLNEAIRQLNFI